MLSPARSLHVKRVALLRALASLLRQSSVRFSGHSVSSEDSEDNATRPSLRSSPPPLIPKLKQNAVLQALASTVNELDHPFFMGRSITDPLAPVTRDKRMKYLMARDAGIKAAEYVIQQWPELFPSKGEVSPDIRPTMHVKQDSGEAALQRLIAQRSTDQALKVFDKFEKRGRKVSLETRNNLLELLSYAGVGNDVGVTNRSKFVEHQQSLNDSNDLEFIPINLAAVKKLSPIQASVDENQILVLSKSENHEHLKLKLPRKVWSLSNDAEMLFESMTERSGRTYDAIMLGLFKYKSYDRMFKLYFTMHKEGFQPSVSTYNYLLMALDHSDNSAAWEIAMELVKKMGSHPVVLPDTTTFNMLLKLSKRTGGSSRETAAAVFQEMLHVGLEPNLTTFMRLLQAYMYNNDPSVIIEIVDYLEQHPQLLRLESYFDLFFFEAAINVANHCGKSDIGARLVEMASKDCWHLVGDIDKFLSPYLVVVSWEKDIQTLMLTYRWLVSKYYRPKDWIYATIFQACAEAKRAECVVELWDDFKKFDVQLGSNQVVGRIHDVLGTITMTDDMQCHRRVAEESWRMLLAKRILPDRRIIGGMVQVCARAKHYQKAWYYYAQFESYGYQPSSSALQCLLDCYAADKSNGHEVLETLRTMVESGHNKPSNYEQTCSDFGISVDFWDQVEATLKEKGNGVVDKGHKRKPKAKGVFTRHKHGVAVKVQGDPSSITEHSLAYFFQEYGVKVEDVKAMKHHSGRPAGEALVVFPSTNVAQKAVRDKSKQALGKRSLTASFKSFSYGVTVMMRGIPFNITDQKIADFFKGYNVDPERDVYIEVWQDGKLSGNAYVTLSSPILAERAIREKNKRRLGKRTVDLSIKAYSGNYGDNAESDNHEVTGLNKSGQTTHSSNHGDTLMVQGFIPFSVTEDELAAFFHEYDVDSKDVQIKVDKAGRPTGVAVVKFQTVDIAVKAMEEKNGKHFVGRPLKLFTQDKLAT